MTNDKKPAQQSPVLQMLKKRSVQDRFEELIGARSATFITSLIQVVQGNDRLQQADPQTVLNAAATAATLNLPVNPSLGFAWIVPYKVKGKMVAQFQIGWKGYVQLALRTGSYSRINVVTVYENQFDSWNELTEELKADFSVEGQGGVAGYVAYFRLNTGFEKVSFWSRQKVEGHAKRYSKGYASGSSTWNDGEDGFNSMGMKTVLSNIIRKYGIMSVEMESALLADHAVQKNLGEYSYVDNPPALDLEQNDYDKERQRILSHIEGAPDIETLQQVRDLVSQYDLGQEYEEKEGDLIQE